MQSIFHQQAVDRWPKCLADANRPCDTLFLLPIAFDWRILVDKCTSFLERTGCMYEWLYQNHTMLYVLPRKSLYVSIILTVSRDSQEVICELDCDWWYLGSSDQWKFIKNIEITMYDVFHSKTSHDSMTIWPQAIKQNYIIKIKCIYRVDIITRLNFTPDMKYFIV